MSEFVLRSSATNSLILSTSFKGLCVFCLLGLLLAAVIVPMVAPEHMAWVLAHIE
jgi:hypothetical protein